jgi:membrane associated rhomboid family serine protease
MVDQEHKPPDPPKRPAYVELSGFLLVLAVVCVIATVVTLLFASVGWLTLIAGVSLSGLLWGVSNALLMLGEIRQSLRDQKPRNADDDNA